MDKNLRIQAPADYIAINPIFKKVYVCGSTCSENSEGCASFITVVINVIMWEKWENVIEVSLSPFNLKSV